MKISRAVQADIPDLCTLLDCLFSQEAEFRPDREALARGLAAVIANPDVGDILTVSGNGRMIGMVNLLYTVSTALGARAALLEDMIISPEWRGKGIGSELLDCAVKFAEEKGCGRITLLTDEDNSAAHRFYRRKGFRRSPMVPFRRMLPVSG